MKEANEKLEKKDVKGITLIALVITIIILLILAGISIGLVAGDNGILAQASKAQEKTTQAQEEENIKLAIMASSIENNGYAEILNAESFEKELKNIFGNQELNVTSNVDGSFLITIDDRKYYVNDDKTLINNDDIIEIGTVEELKAFRDDVNSGNTYEGKTVLLTSDITLSEEWIPIGKYDATSTNPDDNINKKFCGIFDGNFHKIYNLTINSSEKAKGLFALVKQGTIKNIGIESGNISSNSVVGGIVGYAYDNVNISNCYNNATIAINDNFVGGIIGYAKNNVSIESCYNSGEISGKEAGGICGGFENIKILNCYNIGSIRGNDHNTGIGGIGGGAGNSSNNDIIKNNYNIGNLYNISQYSIGGILGNKNISTILENNYFLENTVNGGNGSNVFDGTESKTDIEMKEIHNMLGEAFKEDTENINNGYPILYWE